ncbi:hypothetical protein CDAR_104281 [Caerostris darwini]|uniref:Uncharacterized protein n=1 Tax=Caerostris darwini TaxID=1538125 RepID=A0AAV4PTJ2_9ARAC|nr:hypothetical protein CDAR_104281 [Caerostris darwini]
MSVLIESKPSLTVEAEESGKSRNNGLSFTPIFFRRRKTRPEKEKLVCSFPSSPVLLTPQCLSDRSRQRIVYTLIVRCEPIGTLREKKNGGRSPKCIDWVACWKCRNVKSRFIGGHAHLLIKNRRK